MSDVHKIVGQIREHVNQPRTKYGLLKDRGYWLQLCSCMDTLEDTELAISAYLAHDFESGSGEAYLAVYGLLQALFLQQDAALHLRDALLREGLDLNKMLDEYPVLKTIREVRNDSIGHPTKRGRKAPYSYHFISRITLEHGGFQLITTSGDGAQPPAQDVSIPDLIADQRGYVSALLTSITTKLRQDETEHKEQFKMEKLAAIFSPSSYYIEKVSEGIRRSEEIELATGCLGLLEKQLQEFREKLVARGIQLDTYDSIETIYEELTFALPRLHQFFRDAATTNASSDARKTAEVFLEYVQARFKDLEQIAGGIDEDYAT